MAGLPTIGARLVATAMLLTLTLPFAAPVGAATPAAPIATLEAERLTAVASLERARSTFWRVTRDLRAAKTVYRAAEADFQRTVAAFYMLTEPGGTTPEGLQRLRRGAIDAQWQLQVADVELRAARKVVQGIDDELARARAAERRTGQAQSQRQEAVIACPVASPAAIYDDFGADRPGGPHTGIDIPAPLGSDAVAAWWSTVRELPLGGWIGIGIILEDAAGNLWWYAHLSETLVTVGQVVERGQVIGRVGSTGQSSGPHLHFEVHAAGYGPIDPYSLTSASCGIGDPLGHLGRLAAEADAHPVAQQQ